MDAAGRQKSGTGTALVIAPPLRLILAALLLGLASDRLLPSPLGVPVKAVSP
jgi:hypothetical protein